MKRYTIYICLIHLFYIGCTKDALIQPKQYPYVITKDVAEINTSGVTFEAKIQDYGQEEITDFGFLWSDGKTEYKYSLQNSGTLNDFKIRISTDLENGLPYTCRSYVKTVKKLVLGNKVSFVSLGSENPIIADFNPKEGFDGTLMKLKVKYLSQYLINNKVFINNLPAEIISLSGDTIVVMTPSMAFAGDATVSVKVGSQQSTSNTKFKIFGPEIESVSSLSGHSGNYITIKGKNLIQNGNNIDVSFGSYPAEKISYSGTQIDIIVPMPAQGMFSDKSFLLSDQSLFINIKNGLKTTSFNRSFLIIKSWETRSPTPFNWSYKYEAITYMEKGYILELNIKQFYEYNPNSDQWNSFSSVLYPADRNEGSLYVVSGNNCFKVGGYNWMNLPIYELWAFDFTAKTWNKKRNVPFSFSYATFFNLNSQFYIITKNGEFWKCDFENEVYTRLKNFPITYDNYFISTFIANGKALVVCYGHTYQYDDTSDSWIEKSINPFSKKQYFVQAIGFSTNGTGYVLNLGIELYKYDLANDRWILVSYYPGSRSDNSYKTTFVIGGKAYVAATSGNYVGNSPLMYSYQE